MRRHNDNRAVYLWPAAVGGSENVLTWPFTWLDLLELKCVNVNYSSTEIWTMSNKKNKKRR